jgi:hypothetical protein
MSRKGNRSRDASKNGCKREMTPETTDISGHHGHATVTGTLATAGVLIAEGTPATPGMTGTLRICNRRRLASNRRDASNSHARNITVKQQQQRH